ncbi:hypothetical protein LTR04_003456 [Oleoguttula sp. CCFEE 6159]|nr:hypothetical protein LTR04_003456 [Oleoguttula sp. CCFEE 6159]
MHDPSQFRSYLNKQEHYPNFLRFFQQKVEEHGWQTVAREYLLKGDEQANDLLARLFAGFLHPLIHLGFGVEFNQPAIVVEALTQAALHDNYLQPFFLGAEKAAEAKKAEEASKTLPRLLDDIRADKRLSTAAHWDDNNKIRDGILKRASNEMIGYASQWTVDPDSLEEKTAEMINAVVYYTGCAQHPPKQIKLDFYFMHCVNCSIFFSTFVKQPWLDIKDKVRLLEWKGRNDLVMYASRRSPEPLLDEVINYQPRDMPVKRVACWDQIFDRVANFQEDGHACKMIRALAHGEQASKPYEGSTQFRIKGDMWLKLGSMVMDSVQDTGKTWVRSAGFEEAWDTFDDRRRPQL